MKRVAVLVALGLLVASGASAQTTPSTAPAGSVGSTVDGSLPEKTGSTTAVGQTKPPGSAAPGSSPRLDQESRKLDQRIRNGICEGCD